MNENSSSLRIIVLVLTVLLMTGYGQENQEAQTAAALSGSILHKVEMILGASDEEQPAVYEANIVQLVTDWNNFKVEFDEIIREEDDPLDSIYTIVDIGLMPVDELNPAEGINALKASEEPLKKLNNLIRLPLLVDFSGPRCKACKTMKSRLQNVRKRFSDIARVVYIDVNTHKGLTKKYKIMLIPTLVFIDQNGKEVCRMVGEVEEQVVDKKLNELLKDRE